MFPYITYKMIPSVHLRLHSYHQKIPGRDQHIIVDSKQTVTQQYGLVAKKGKCTVVCISKIIANKSIKVIFFSYYSIWPWGCSRILCPFYFFIFFSSVQDFDILEWIKERSTKIMRMLHHKIFKKRMTDLGFFSVKRLRRDTNVVFFCRRQSLTLSAGIQWGRRSSGHKLQREKLCLDIRKKFFHQKGNKKLGQISQRVWG